MPHPSKTQDPVSRSELKQSVNVPEWQRKQQKSTKKNGNGTHAWGRIDDYEGPPALDKNDPNFDPAEQDSVFQGSSW